MSETNEPGRNLYASPSAAAPPVQASPRSQEGGRSLLQTVRNSQIIRGALIQGVVLILVMLWVSSKDNKKADPPSIFLLVGGVVLVSTIVASFVVPTLMKPVATVAHSNELSEAIMTADEKEMLPTELTSLLQLYNIQTIVVGAVLEGGAVLNTIFWFLGANRLHLLFVAIAILMMLIRFPTVMRLREFLVHQIRSHH